MHLNGSLILYLIQQESLHIHNNTYPALSRILNDFIKAEKYNLPKILINPLKKVNKGSSHVKT